MQLFPRRIGNRMARKVRVGAKSSLSRLCLMAMNLCLAMVFAIVVCLAALDWAYDRQRLQPHEGWKMYKLLGEGDETDTLQSVSPSDFASDVRNRCQCTLQDCGLSSALDAKSWHRGLLERDYTYMQAAGCKVDNGTSGGMRWQDALEGMPQFHARIHGESIHFVWIRGLKVSRRHLQGAFDNLNIHMEDNFAGKLHETDAMKAKRADQEGEVPVSTALALVHGWPGSVLEYIPMARLLMEASSQVQEGDTVAFEVDLVIPSLPRFGIGGSDSPVNQAEAEVPGEASEEGGPTARDRQGTGAHRAAAILARLMCRLGYCPGAEDPTDPARGQGYVVAGGDWGGMVAPMIAQMDPCSVRMVHTALPIVLPRPTHFLRYLGGAAIDALDGLHIQPEDRPSAGKLLAQIADRSGLSKLLFLTPEERRVMRLPAAQFLRNAFDQSAYMHQQMTRPYTLGRVLRSSPEAMHAWTEEKILSWSGCGAALQSRWQPWMNSSGGPIEWAASAESNGTVPVPPVESFLAAVNGPSSTDGASRMLQQALSCYADAAAIAFGKDPAAKAGLGLGVPAMEDPAGGSLLSAKQVEQAAAFVHAMSRIHIDGGTQGSWLEIYADSLMSSMFWGLQISDVDVPAVILDNPGEVVARVPRRWSRSRFRGLLRTTTPAHDGMGNPAGHFFAMERPRLFLDEMLRTLQLDAMVDGAKSGFVKDAAERRRKACKAALPYIGHVHDISELSIGGSPEEDASEAGDEAASPGDRTEL